MRLIEYKRVIPRDFFNEAKLLKCMGRLAVLIHDCKLPPGISITLSGQSDEPFDVRMTVDGCLTIVNCAAKINGFGVRFKTTYNSMSSYPLICEFGEGVEVDVLDDGGNFMTTFASEVKRILRYHSL